MPQGPKMQQFRGTGAPAAGQLLAGQWYLDVTANKWYYSTNGTTIVALADALATLASLTDVAIASPADNHLLAYDAASSKWTNQTPAQVGVVAATEKGAPNGVATLGADSKIPSSQLPALAISSVYTVNTIAERDALTVQEGDVAKVLTNPPETYIYNGTVWVELDTTTPHVHDAADIASGNLVAARMSANVGAALNASAAVTINNANLVFDGGTA